MPAPDFKAAASTPVRGTQSFVGTLSSVWSRPGLLMREVAWRWLFGAPALVLTGYEVPRILLGAMGTSFDPAMLGLKPAMVADPVGSLASDPLATASALSKALDHVYPQLGALALWLLPLLFVAWLILSTVGRTAMLRRADPALTARPLTLMVWHAIRVLAIAAMFLVFFRTVIFAAAVAIITPIDSGGTPNFVLFCAIVIVATLGLFVLWGFLGWFFSLAPLLAMARNLTFAQTIPAAWRIGPLRSKLVEINLVMGIVKIALIVLAMVFTATPLPFESVATPAFLFWWWIGVMIIYFLWSDFFHVARLVGYLQLFRRYSAE